MSSSQKIILSALRVICRKYKLCILLGIGLLIIFFQGFSSYYIYQEIDGTIDGDYRSLSFKDYGPVKTSLVTSSNYFLQYIKQPQSKSFYSQSIRKETTVRDSCNEEFGIFCPCILQTKEALSAIHRATSTHCKQKIANISCSVQNGTFYPHKLQSLCPTDGHTKGTYLGCYIDDRENRILDGYVKQLKKNSLSICADICLQRGYIYSGVEYSKECFCGNKELPVRQRVPDTECDMMCPNDSEEKLKCGGYLRVSIVETGLAKIVPHALKRPNVNDSPTVRIAYILVVNGRALRQVHRLIKALYHKDHFFFIHVDLRQDYLYRELLLLETIYSNILLSRKRYSSIWGGTSLLSVLLHCMRELFIKKDWQWDFVINLSESDFPIKTNTMLVEFLTANKDRNFLKSHGHDTNKFIQKQGLDQTFLECETHMWRLGVRNLPLGIRMDGGSDWVCLTREFVSYFTHERDELVNGLLKFFSYTLLPGESFFHTVLKNSHFCQSFSDNNLHVTNWKRKLGCRCQYKHIVDWCGCSPNDFTLEDWPKVEAAMSRNLFFARKFEPVINIKVINKIDKLLYGSFDAATPNLNSYWENIFHNEDLASSIEDIDLTIYHAASRFTQYAFKDYYSARKIISVEALKNSNNASNVVCDLIPSKILQSFAYKVNDLAEGMLVEFSAHSQSNQQNIKVQAWIQPRMITNIIQSEYTPHRLKKVEVSSHLDLKEQVFRDFGRSLGPKSTIAIMTWWHSSERMSNTEDGKHHSDYILKPKVLLIDSVGALAAEVELTVNEEEQAVDHTFTVSGPLRPGMWKSFVIVKDEILATVEFAVLPFQFYEGQKISVADGRSMHGGPSKPYSDVSFNPAYSNLIKEVAAFPGNESLLKIATEKSKKFGPELLYWIDQIFETFYLLKGICHIPSEVDNNSCIERVTLACPEVSWSSYSPDPKSSLGEVDPATGRLHDPHRVRPTEDS